MDGVTVLAVESIDNLSTRAENLSMEGDPLTGNNQVTFDCTQESSSSVSLRLSRNRQIIVRMFVVIVRSILPSPQMAMNSEAARKSKASELPHERRCSAVAWALRATPRFTREDGDEPPPYQGPGLSHVVRNTGGQERPDIFQERPIPQFAFQVLLELST